jgi:hypothetical protein
MGETPGQKYRREKAEAAAAEAAAAAQEAAAKQRIVANVGRAVNKTFDVFLKECENTGRRHEECVRYAFKASESLAVGTNLPQLAQRNRRYLLGGKRKTHRKSRKGRKSYRKRK